MDDWGIRDSFMVSILVCELVYKYLGIINCFSIRLLVDNSDDILAAKKFTYQNILHIAYLNHFGGNFNFLATGKSF